MSCLLPLKIAAPAEGFLPSPTLHPDHAICMTLAGTDERIAAILTEAFVFNDTTHAYLLKPGYRIDHLTRGTYVVGLEAGKKIAIVKPADEVRGASACRPRGDFGAGEANLPAKEGISPELETPHEVIASALGPRFLGAERDYILPGAIVRLTGPFFSPTQSSDVPTEETSKLVFLQPFVDGSVSLDRSEYAGNPERVFERMSPSSFMQLVITDLILGNCDRNLGNLLVDPNSGEVVAFIDHALIGSAGAQARSNLAWRASPRTQRPLTAEAREWIAGQTWERAQAHILSHFPNYPKANLDAFEVFFYLLQQGAAAELTPFEIGAFHCGDAFGSPLMIFWEDEQGKEDPIGAVKAKIDAAIMRIVEGRAKAPALLSELQEHLVGIILG